MRRMTSVFLAAAIAFCPVGAIAFAEGESDLNSQVTTSQTAPVGPDDLLPGSKLPDNSTDEQAKKSDGAPGEEATTQDAENATAGKPTVEDSAQPSEPESKTLPDLSSELKPFSPAKKITTIGGATRFETSEAQALDGWTSSNWAIVASAYSYADSICGSGLAGALGCPILLTDGGTLSSTASDVITKLSVKHVIVLGGEDVVSSQVANQLERLVGEKVTRLAGDTRFETQTAIYDFGVEYNLWNTDTAIVSYGWNFADALSVSPIAYKLKAPIFFADGTLPDAQAKEILTSDFNQFIVTGGSDVVYESAVSQLKSKGSVVRLGGDTRFETSAEIARYAVSSCGMTWDGMAFSSGWVPFDALGGGALQGSRNSVLVLKNEGDSTGANIPSGANPSNYVYFGGGAVYSDAFKILMAKRFGYDPSQIDGASYSTNGNWYYIDGRAYYWNGSDWTRGWAHADGSRFFEYDTGAMHTGWYSENGIWFDFGSDGVFVSTHYHNIEWAGQPNNYYCGPTSGYMILRNVGAWTSAWGDGLNIWNVADYMHTDNYGYTSFQDRWFARGMNNWLGHDVYTSVHTPSYVTVRNAIMGSYYNGYATALDEQERRGGPHFNGHNNGTFAHIMVVDGYDWDSDSVYICDPGAPVLWPSGSGHFWYWSLRDFVETYMQNEINGARERIGVHYAWY